MWIPTGRATEGMKDTDKPRDKVFGFVQGEKIFFDDIRNSLETVSYTHLYMAGAAGYAGRVDVQGTQKIIRS